jgi:hypothetical protein
MSDRSIQEAIQKLAGTQLSDEVYLIPCTVDSVDLSTRSCSCTAIGGTAVTEINGVLLMASVDDGFLIIPSLDSTVIVSYSKRQPPFISLFSAVEQVLIITGEASISIKDGLTQLNDGSFGGLVKVAALTTKINNLENLLNNFITLYNAHFHPVAGSTTTPTVSIETGVITLTQRAEIENITIKHGS